MRVGLHRFIFAPAAPGSGGFVILDDALRDPEQFALGEVGPLFEELLAEGAAALFVMIGARAVLAHIARFAGDHLHELVGLARRQSVSIRRWFGPGPRTAEIPLEWMFQRGLL